MTTREFATAETRLVRNLKTLYARSTTDDKRNGLSWYPSARAIVGNWADKFGLSPEVVSCIVSAVSPQCLWQRNLQIAYDVVADRPLSPGFVLYRNLDKARAIRRHGHERIDVLDTMRQHFPFGPKVQNFALNIYGDTNAVTIDVHAAQASINEVSRVRVDRLPIYAAIANAYRLAADDCGIVPCDFQAILWHTWKAMYPAETKRRVLRMHNGGLPL